MIDQHSDLLQMEVPAGPSAPAAVRASVRRIPGLGANRSDAMLVASELVTNAVLHTTAAVDPWLLVRLSRAGGTFVLSVLAAEASDGLEVPAEVTGVELGLVVVDRLARRWGTEQADGYRIWAELAC